MEREQPCCENARSIRDALEVSVLLLRKAVRGLERSPNFAICLSRITLPIAWRNWVLPGRWNNTRRRCWIWRRGGGSLLTGVPSISNFNK